MVSFFHHDKVKTDQTKKVTGALGNAEWDGPGLTGSTAASWGQDPK